MTGSWKAIVNQPSFNVDTMLLLTDGSVLCHEDLTPNWYRLVPNQTNSDYTTGTWSQVASLPANAPNDQNGPQNAPLYYASAVLRDGTVFMAGGEYNGLLPNGQGDQVDLLAVQSYDPVADAWTSLPNPAGFANIGDAPTCVLPDGKVLMGNINAVGTAIFDPVAGTWATGGNKHDTSSEETWTLLPDNTILCAEVNNHPNAEKYVIASNTWVTAPSVPAANDLVLNAPVSIEIGPAILMPNGRVFGAGASGHTAVFNNDPAELGWVGGPDFPTDSNGNLKRAFDAPACLLPNGKVLCCAGQVVTSGGDTGWAGHPAEFFEFDGTHLNPAPALASMAQVPTYNCRMLLLPTGQVLVSSTSNHLDLYEPDGHPENDWRPTITSVPSFLLTGLKYTLKGTQLNGLSQAVCYGDDAQMATNYPIVTLRPVGTNKVYYCRTFDHSTMAVATGPAIVSTHFQVPGYLGGGFEPGLYELTVIANGIPSVPVQVTVGSLRIPSIPLKQIFENLTKDSEGDPELGYGIEGDPAWLQAIRLLLAENDALVTQVQEMKAFIGAADRPELGTVAATQAARGERGGD